MASSIISACHRDCCDSDEGREFTDPAKSAALDALARLLSAENSIDFHSGDGKSVLKWACETGRLDVMRLLVDRGAPIDMVI